MADDAMVGMLWCSAYQTRRYPDPSAACARATLASMLSAAVPPGGMGARSSTDIGTGVGRVMGPSGSGAVATGVKAPGGCRYSCGCRCADWYRCSGAQAGRRSGRCSDHVFREELSRMSSTTLPTDPDLDLDLAEVVLTAVVRLDDRFLLRASAGRGRYRPGGTVRSTDADRAAAGVPGPREGSGAGVRHTVEMSFSLVDPPGRPGVADRVYEVLTGWRDTARALRLIGAPGRSTVLFEPGGTAVEL